MKMAPRPAATLILLRNGPGDPEVLMLERSKSSAFLGGAYVFPGGALEPQDSDACLFNRVLGLTDRQASVRLGLSSGGLAYYVAAVRECFEEAGVLFACDKQGSMISATKAEKLLLRRSQPFLELLNAEGLFIPGRLLAYFGHWVTPAGRPRRFDTRFFLGLEMPGQEGAHDEIETVHHAWLSPAQALARNDRGEIEVAFATQQTLKGLARFGEPQAAFAYAANLDEIPSNRVCQAQGKEGARLFHSSDPQYCEIQWSDPEETGKTTYDLVPGVPRRLDRLVRRIIAPNPGAMTGPGTNTYLVGERDIGVIDPGPAISSHIETILKEGKGSIRRILCTHTHMDHSPAAMALKEATGAQVLGPPAPQGQDVTFKPDLVVENGQRIDLGGATLRAIHTPGHASNHLCYLLEETRMLFTGDHVMQGSTVVINPPDGDMRAYLASLEMLLAEDIAILAPGHGYLIGSPHREIRRLIAHRLAREKKVTSVLARLGPASVDELVPSVYDDVPARMHRWAARSLTAHLAKLVAENSVRADDGRYTLVRPPKA